VALSVKMEQMCFSGSAGCPQFTPNPFKKDICGSCQNKIQSHSSATPQQVAAALEYSVDNVASDVWQHQSSGARLYLGGYKSANNVSYLQKNVISVVINTAKGLEATLGPKYIKQVQDRARKLPELEVVNLDWRDDATQILDFELIKQTMKLMERSLDGGQSVLVHCAQGKSRSSSVVLCFLSWKLKTSVIESLSYIQSRRNMAQPNQNFMDQILNFERSGQLNEI